MYIIQEIQTTGGQTALLPAVTFTDRNEAESAFHLKLGSAAVSSVDVHTVLMYDEHGNVLRREYYEHAGE
jgi:hypothetical protein